MKAAKTLLLLAVLFSAGQTFAQTWMHTSAPSNRWWSVVCSADGTKVAALSLSKIYTSTNSGTTWISNSIPNLSWQCLASSADGKRLVAVAWKGGPIYLSTNSGATWAPTTAPNNYWSSVASSADGSRLVASAADAGTDRIYTSTNGGTTWTMTTAPAAYWLSVASSADGIRLLATTYGMIYTSTNSGATWSQTVTTNNSSPTPGNAAAMSADGTRQIAAPGGGGGVYASTNSGKTWSLTTLSPALHWNSVASSVDGTRLIAASPSGLIYTSTNFGATWVSNSTPNLPWYSVACSANGCQFYAAAAGNSSGEIWALSCAPLSALKLTPPANGKLNISWTIPSTNMVLQYSADMVSWGDVTNVPAMNCTNLQNEVSLPAAGSKGYYRLKTP